MRIVIAGGGHAAGMAAAALRQNGFTGDCTIAGDEPFPPYQRPPLSKQFMAGEYDSDRLLLRPAAFYAAKHIALRTGRRVTGIDTTARCVLIDDATALPYDRLLLALGTRARRLDVPGGHLAGIHYLRNIADATALRPELVAPRRLVIVGAGYVGLEVAAVAAARGMQVSVLEVQRRILERVATPALSARVQALHAGHGVDIRCGVRVTAFTGATRVERVVTDAGELAADAVLVGVGAVANDETAVAAGIACDQGVLADAHCRTDTDGVFAAGDVCRGDNVALGRRVRLESVPNATEQARVVAATLLDREARCEAVPWFWSDQYDVKLQMAGLSEDGRRSVTRGEAAAANAPWISFHLAGDRVVAADAMNDPRSFLAARALIEKRVPVSDDQLADPGFDLRTLVR
jgi:3-phenylpropionate/trans-cinnamate dioxygenase ferredoxin reductase subunit